MTRRCPVAPPSRAAAHDGSAQRRADSDTSLPEAMTDEERSAVRRGLSDLTADRFASEAEVDAAFRRFRP